MTARARFRQLDLKRALKAFEDAQLPIAGVEFNDNGFIVLVGEELRPRRKNKADELYGPEA